MPLAPDLVRDLDHALEDSPGAKDKRVVLGLVTTKVGELESKDALKRRIDEAARYVPLERLGISPQCGFASHHKGTSLSFEEQEAKLRRVVETATAVWGTA